MRPIDADALQLAIVEAGQANKGGRYKIGDFWELNGAEIREVIDAQPTIEPMRKKGRWLEHSVFDEPQGKHIEQWQSARCSVCGKYHTTPYMYYFDWYDWCPNCGAEMRQREVAE